MVIGRNYMSNNKAAVSHRGVSVVVENRNRIPVDAGPSFPRLGVESTAGSVKRADGS